MKNYSTILFVVLLSFLGSCYIFYPEEAEEFLENYYSNQKSSFVVYVDLNRGSDSGEGIPSSPFKTISRAVQYIISSGGSGTVKVAGSGAEENLVLNGLGEIEVNAGYTNVNGVWVSLDTSDESRLTKFKGKVVMNSCSSLSFKGFSFNPGVISDRVSVSNSTGVLFKDCKFSSFTNAVFVNSSQVVFERCWFNNNYFGDASKGAGCMVESGESRVFFYECNFYSNGSDDSGNGADIAAVDGASIFVVASRLSADNPNSSVYIENNSSAVLFSSVLIANSPSVYPVNLNGPATCYVVNSYIKGTFLCDGALGTNENLYFYNSILETNTNFYIIEDHYMVSNLVVYNNVFILGSAGTGFLLCRTNESSYTSYDLGDDWGEISISTNTSNWRDSEIAFGFDLVSYEITNSSSGLKDSGYDVSGILSALQIPRSYFVDYYGVGRPNGAWDIGPDEWW